MKLIRRVYFADLFALRVWAASTAVWCGLFVMLPFPITTQPWSVLGLLLPEWVWGGGLMAVGLWQYVSAFYDQHHLNSGISSAAGVYQWAFLMFGAWASDRHQLSCVVYALMTVIWVWVLLRQKWPQGEAASV